MSGVTVTFAAPASGASGTFAVQRHHGDNECFRRGDYGSFHGEQRSAAILVRLRERRRSRQLHADQYGGSGVHDHGDEGTPQIVD